jgi:alginate O-acetyltransferase complex protein AlgI
MLFHTFQFAIFFTIVYALYRVLPHQWQNRMLLVASYVFYGAWDWRYLSLLLASTTVDFFCGLAIKHSSETRNKKAFVAISIIFNIGILCIFKYFDFFAENFQTMMAQVGITVQPYFLNIALPIGISFYTFQTMSYTIDVYRGKVEATRSFFDFALYVAFFPQLVAGPIERGSRLLPQILRPRIVTLKLTLQGMYLVLWGLFLKITIADNLATIIDPIFAAGGSAYDGGMVLLGTYAFAFQIYCDFAGYSFIAIGLGQMMGITLMENFKRPYFSRNISEFWRRWHISLSSWFRDYVFSPFYIFCEKKPILRQLPLKLRHAIAFFITLLVTECLLGFWHGAGWNYGMFGVFHGLMIWAYYYSRFAWDKLNPFIQILFTFHIACLGWLIFRAPTLGQGMDMLRDLFANFEFSDDHIDVALRIVALISVLVVVQIIQHWKNDTYAMLKLPRVLRDSFIVLLVCLIALFGASGERAFIYFQF